MNKPQVTNRPHRKNKRNRLKTPRLVSGSAKAKPIHKWVNSSPQFTQQQWQTYYVKDMQKGPKVVEVKRATVYPKNDKGLPSRACHLLVVRDVTADNTLKYFLSYAPINTSVEVLLKVGYSRWRVERCFEDDKKYVGMDHYEGRCYFGLLRHLIISSVSLLFLARVRKKLEQSYPDLTISQVYQATSAVIHSWWLTPADAVRLLDATAYKIDYYQRRNAQARKSHTRTRIARLQGAGIDINTMKQCDWDDNT